MNTLGFMKKNTFFIVLINILSGFASVHAGLSARDYVQLTGVAKAQCVLNGPSEINLSPISIVDTVDKPVGTRLGSSQIFYMQSNCDVPMKIKITAQGVHPITKCVSPMDLDTGIISENYYQLCLFVDVDGWGQDFLEFQNLTATTKSFTSNGERILFNVISSQGSYTSLTELSSMPARLVTSLTLSIIVE